MFIGLGSGFFSDNALFIHPSHEIMLDTEFGVPTLFKLLPLIFTISLSVIAIVLSEYLSTILIYFKLSRVGYNIFSFFNQRFLIELFYNKYVTGIVLKLGGQTTKVLDKGSVEYIGPYGLEKGLLNISNNIAKLSTGVITSYALYILIGLIAYLLFNSYINSSSIILVLVISLSLVLFQNSKSISPRTVSLQSSTQLQNMLSHMYSYVEGIPSGREMRKEVGDDINKVSELVNAKTKMLKEIKRGVNRLADSELRQESVTPELTNQINHIKQEVARLSVQGGNDLAEGMQAVAD
jgi:archaellum component FlaC